MGDFSEHKQAMRKANEAYRQSLLSLLLTPSIVTLDTYAPTVINTKEDKCKDLFNSHRTKSGRIWLFSGEER